MGAQDVVRVAVLHCDETPVYGVFTRELFADLFESDGIGLVHFDVHVQEYPAHWDNIHAVVITGSVASAIDTQPWVLRLSSEIRYGRPRARTREGGGERKRAREARERERDA